MKPISIPLKIAIQEYYGKGYSIGQIAIFFRVSKSTVHKYLKNTFPTRKEEISKLHDKNKRYKYKKTTI